MSISKLDALLNQGGGVNGLRVFVRADLNVPLSDGKVADDSRIRASLPTLQKLRAAGARVIVTSHLGRPKGQRKAELSLAPVAAELAKHLGVSVSFASDCIGPEAERAVADLKPGQVLLLENLRFHAEETANDPKFSEALAKLADVYVNDAFGAAHRAHASTVGMTAFVKRKAAGLLILNEIEHLNRVLDPKRPFVCFLGGAKVSDKLAALDSLVPRADVLAIGGAMAYTFLMAQGVAVGKSLVEPDLVPDAQRLLAAARAAGHRLLLPTDHLAAQALEAGTTVQLCTEIPAGWMGVDIGPKTAALYAAEAQKAATIFWNGPMGVFEVEDFAGGTLAVAEAIAKSSGTSIVGGGDSLAAVHQMGFADRIDHLSTGGGASLEYIQGKQLPGIVALESAE